MTNQTNNKKTTVENVVEEFALKFVHQDKISALSQESGIPVDIWLRTSIQKVLHSLISSLESQKRKGFKETNTWSEVQQEIAWTNDGISQSIKIIRERCGCSECQKQL